MNNKIKLQEGYSFCEACEGTGATPMYMDCRDSSNNCCGGCEWVYEECKECDGSGQIEIEEDEYDLVLKSSLKTERK